MNRQRWRAAFCGRDCHAGACDHCHTAWHWRGAPTLEHASCPRCGRRLRSTWHGSPRIEWIHAVPREQSVA